jgi:hypothetical protein
VVEAALWCFWHGDSLASGEVLLGVLLGWDERVRLVYGLLVGVFYMGELLGFDRGRLNFDASHLNITEKLTSAVYVHELLHVVFHI